MPAGGSSEAACCGHAFTCRPVASLNGGWEDSWGGLTGGPELCAENAGAASVSGLVLQTDTDVGRTCFVSRLFPGDAITLGAPILVSSELHSPFAPELEMCLFVLPASQASAACQLAKARRPLYTVRLEGDLTQLLEARGEG